VAHDSHGSGAGRLPGSGQQRPHCQGARGASFPHGPGVCAPPENEMRLLAASHFPVCSGHPTPCLCCLGGVGLRWMGSCGTWRGPWRETASWSSSTLRPTKAETPSGTPALTFWARYKGGPGGRAGCEGCEEGSQGHRGRGRWAHDPRPSLVAGVGEAYRGLLPSALLPSCSRQQGVGQQGSLVGTLVGAR